MGEGELIHDFKEVALGEKGIERVPGMSFGQLTDISSFFNRKSTWTITPLKIFKPINWNSRSSRRKL
jgi:hypothetical protein